MIVIIVLLSILLVVVILSNNSYINKTEKLKSKLRQTELDVEELVSEFDNLKSENESLRNRLKLDSKELRKFKSKVEAFEIKESKKCTNSVMINECPEGLDVCCVYCVESNNECRCDIIDECLN